MNTDSDSTILEWRGLTVRHFPATHHYVYLLHFHTRLHHAGHYLGSSSFLDTRLALHKSGNGARLMAVISDAGISWELARLWECDSREASLALERKLKHRHESPRLCPICQHREKDILVSMREGHPALAIHAHSGRRRPLVDAPRWSAYN